jgi:REP element-mobilizing transposase RayT
MNNPNNKYNPDLHHRRSVRLRDYDYSQEGLYFITLCVQNRECIFGNVVDGADDADVAGAGACRGVARNAPTDTPTMILNEIGEIVRREWLKTAELRPNVVLHNFVVMPNHFHGILEITAKCTGVAGFRRGVARNAPTENAPIRPYARATDYEKNEYMSNISPKSGEMGTIIRAFKSAVTRNIHAAGYDFAWQRNLWEHISRLCPY